MNRTLFLDFDGVIAKSDAECLVVGINAFNSFLQINDRISSPCSANSKVVEEFYRLRPFIKSGEDYLYILYSIHLNAKIASQTEFTKFTQKYSHFNEIFYKSFYKERHIFFNENFSKWIELNPLYDGIKDYLSLVQNNCNLYIVSSKESFYIDSTLKANGVTFNRSNIFHEKTAEQKIERIMSIDRSGIFIDDSLDIVKRAIQSSVDARVAKWGYAEKTIPKEIPSLTLEEFKAVLYNFLA